MVKHVRWWALLAVCGIAVGGCGQGGAKRPATAPVSGTVKLKGQPLAGAQVVFRPKEGGAVNPSGESDSQGKYQLTSFAKDDGAPAGAYTVTVTKAQAVSGTAGMSATPTGPGGKMSDAYLKAMKGGGAPTSDEVPAKYGDPKASGLEFTVKPGAANTIDIDLQ
jgi:hypothetical protein